MNGFLHRHGLLLAGALILAAPPAVRAQLVDNLDVGNAVPVTDALGRNLLGTWDYPEESCRIEVREVGPMIYPPDPQTGEGNEEKNPLVREAYLGYGVVGDNPGKFSIGFSNRLAQGTSYFVRVYTPPGALDEAIYYADTTPFDGPPAGVASLNVEFQGLRLVSGEEDVDTDGDGIPDALENEIDTIPSERDSDNDGYNDWFEAFYVPYMDPLVSNEVDFAVSLNSPIEPGTEPHTVSWWTLPVPGMTYLLEYTDALPFEEEFTVVIETNVATDAFLQVPVDDLLGTNDPTKGFFRVTVPYPGP